jgi:hypothetical protein
VFFSSIAYSPPPPLGNFHDDIDDILLTRLLFFIKVADDDDLAINGRTKKTMVEVIEEPPSKILIP